MNKITPKEKDMQESKMVVRRALQIAEKRREVKARGERKTYSTASKFQRIAREIQKPSYEQFKEIEENNRMGKSRDLF